MQTDPRIDHYIESRAGFARPILDHLRAQVHRTCPDAQETLKWSSPAFLYNGQILCSFVAFKAHAAFGFWRGTEVTGESDAAQGAMGQFGRVTSLDDLPDDAMLAELILKAMALIDGGTKAPRAIKHPKSVLPVPADLAQALVADAAARATFDRLSPSQRREYVEWIVEAKRAETKAKRLAQTIEWLAQGKPRHWKYQNC